jgi:hypothetical protein
MKALEKVEKKGEEPVDCFLTRGMLGLKDFPGEKRRS